LVPLFVASTPALLAADVMPEIPWLLADTAETA
jgi:hypothetical protein